MIRFGSLEWENLLTKLNKSFNKSNRDFFCTKCWAIISYELNHVHKKEAPDHSIYILKAKDFCSEDQLLEIGKNLNKIQYIGGQPHLENPYKKRIRFRGFRNLPGVRKYFFHQDLEQEKSQSAELDNSENQSSQDHQTFTLPNINMAKNNRKQSCLELASTTTTQKNSYDLFNSFKIKSDLQLTTIKSVQNSGQKFFFGPQNQTAQDNYLKLFVEKFTYSEE